MLPRQGVVHSSIVRRGCAVFLAFPLLFQSYLFQISFPDIFGKVRNKSRCICDSGFLPKPLQNYTFYSENAAGKDKNIKFL
jgi:hypothetical protein